MSSTLKKLLMVLGLVLVIYLVYYFMSKPTLSTDGFAVNVAQEELTRSSEQILADMGRVDSIVIDKTFFNNQNFKSLVDTRVMLTDIPTGRSNPFAPLD